MYKIKSLLPVFLMGLFLLSACGNNTESLEVINTSVPVDTAVTDDTSKARELRIAAHQWMLGKYLLEDAAKDYEASHPNIHVTITPIDNKDTDLFYEDLKAGQADYDMIIGWEAASLKKYIQDDLLADWDNFIQNEVPSGDFVGAFLELGKYRGKQYVMPMTGEVMSVVVRKDLMEQAGLVDDDGNLVSPKSWDEFYEYAKKLTTDETVGGCIMFTGNFMTQSYIYGLQAATGNILNADKTTLDFESEDAEAMLSVWQKGVQDGYFVEDTSTCRAGMKQGEVAMLVASHSRWPEVENELIVDGDITIMPLMQGDNGALAYIHGVWLPKDAENLDLAADFVKTEILNDDYLKWTQENYGKMSPLISTYDQLEDQRWSILMRDAQTSAITPPYNDYAALNELMLDKIGKVLAGDMTPQEALKEMADQSDVLYIEE